MGRMKQFMIERDELFEKYLDSLDTEIIDCEENSRHDIYDEFNQEMNTEKMICPITTQIIKEPFKLKCGHFFETQSLAVCVLFYRNTFYQLCRKKIGKKRYSILLYAYCEANLNKTPDNVYSRILYE